VSVLVDDEPIHTHHRNAGDDALIGGQRQVSGCVFHIGPRKNKAAQKIPKRIVRAHARQVSHVAIGWNRIRAHQVLLYFDIHVKMPTITAPAMARGIRNTARSITVSQEKSFGGILDPLF
jgi:hypothetical protein